MVESLANERKMVNVQHQAGHILSEELARIHDEVVTQHKLIQDKLDERRKEIGLKSNKKGGMLPHQGDTENK